MTPTDVPRLITIGETMVLVTPSSPESLATAAEFRLDAGGAESNVAAHVAQLGIHSAWVSDLGSDALGERIESTLRARGVDTRWVTAQPELPTGVYFKDPGNGVLYYRRGSAAAHMGPATIAHVPLEQAEIVHVTGITPALSSSCAALVDSVIDRVERSDALLSFDVNHRPALWQPGVASGVLRSLARRADIVFVGLDEAQALWGCTDAASVRALLPEPAQLVVKDGDVGATEFIGDESTFVPAILTEVVEVVGAGDAFAAGYIAALLAGRSPNERLRAGHERASRVLRSTSDFVISDEQDS